MLASSCAARTSRDSRKCRDYVRMYCVGVEEAFGKAAGSISAPQGSVHVTCEALDIKEQYSERCLQLCSSCLPVFVSACLRVCLSSCLPLSHPQCIRTPQPICLISP